MTLELNEKEVILLEKALISNINKANKHLQQSIKKNIPSAHWVQLNEERKVLLKKLEKLLPLKYSYDS